MTTSPFTPAREANLKTTVQGGQLAILKQWEDAAQFVCCISGTTVGVAKDPVCVLTIDDRTQCLNTNITVDFSRSWSPDDVLEGQPYTIIWGDGSPNTTGNFPSPRNPAAETETKAGGYSAVGYYTIIMEIEDSRGATSRTQLQIYVRDCSLPPNPLPWPQPPAYQHFPWTTYGEIASADTEVYFTTTINSGSPAWTAVAGGALGATDLQDIALELLNDGVTETMYVADVVRIYEHPMPPNSGAWTSRVTADAMATAAGVDASTHTCSCRRLAVSIENDGWQWCTWRAARKFPYSVNYEVGVASTRDGWQSIYSSAVVDTVTWDSLKTQDLWIWGIDIVQNTQGQVVYCAVGWADDVAGTPGTDLKSKLFRSTNFGQSWAQVDSIDEYNRYPDVVVPFNDGLPGDYVYWANNDRLRRSTTQGVGWSTIALFVGLPNVTEMYLSADITRNDIVTILARDKLHEWRTSAMVTITPDFPVTITEGMMVRERDVSTDYASSTIRIGSSGVTSYIKENAGGAINDKLGTWTDPTPAAIAHPELREYAT